jgi:hypothetical protein
VLCTENSDVAVIHKDQVGSWDVCQLKAITQLVAPRGTPGSFSHTLLLNYHYLQVEENAFTVIVVSFVHKAWQWRILSVCHLIVL